MDPIKVLNSDCAYIKKFRLYGTKTTFKFNPTPNDVSEIDWLRSGFSNIVQKVKAEAIDTDQVGFTLTSINLTRQEPGYVAFTPVAQLSNDVLWEIFGGIVQSNAHSITSTDTFKVYSTRVSLPVGGGGGRKRPGIYNSFGEECKLRKGIIQIKNTDNLCLPRALVVAKAYVKKNPQFELINKDRRNRQSFKAKKLMAKARVNISESGGCGIPELEKFQAHLKKYKITVFNYDKKGRDVYFNGDNPEAKLKINLLFHEGHFNVITSLTAAFSCGYFCEACFEPYNTKGVHRCSLICSSCQSISPPCVLEHEGIVCPQCNIRFKNRICFSTHKGRQCNSIKKCTSCDRLINLKARKSIHQCGEVFCSMCRDFMPPNHQCYMQVNRGSPKSDGFLFIFFDLETRQDEQLENSLKENVHIVNLCVSQQFCWQCINKGEECPTCPSSPLIFQGDPITQFMDYVLKVRKIFKDVCVIAHNGQGFDFQFLMKYVLGNTKFVPKAIMRGTKIMFFEIDNVRFIDSLNYLPMSLSALPKAFDLGPEKKKGYFPHLFNTIANQTYIGPIPAKEYYCPDSMFDKNNKEFEKWYNEQVNSNYAFDFQKELVEYCMSDVDILAQACIKFRALFLEECNVDPFLEAITIAGACNLAFRRNFLKPNTIGLIPKNGYRLVDKQSAKALQWLTWEEEQRHIRIRHSGREKEVKILGKKVDGFDGTRVYEFQGCYWHGCPRCFPYKRDEPLKEDPSDSLTLRYNRTKIKITKLKESGYEVIEMWECGFDELKKKNNLTHLNDLPVLNSLPLDPRDAFYGGRTDCSKVYYKCSEGETIKYIDILSLYPSINKYGKYPLGHPDVYVGHDECLARGMNVEGLLKCKVLPPTDLYHPVLPLKMNKKLMFILCRTCGNDLIENDCNHDSESRALVGTWTMDEIRKSVEKGYIILEMYELWEYKVATFETGGLFTGFIDKFLKIKQEASGFPGWCLNDNDAQCYIKDYFEHEGINLNIDKVQKNGGLRSLAKLMLNSFWGKFGQRENQAKALITRDSEEFFRILTSHEIQVNAVQVLGEEVLIVNWQYLDEISESLHTTNVVIAAYTTAQARLKLYEHLDALGSRVLYYDTDSVLYISKDGLVDVPTGDYLGMMTDELAEYGPGSFITEFVSGGPKTYAYNIFSTNENKIISVCKVKGLTLNLKTATKINFESLKDMVLNEDRPPVEIIENRIRRNNDKEVVTVRESKVFKVTGPKRKRHGEYDTLPYGYTKKIKTL